MSLFSKIKDILFDEEEVKEQKVVKDEEIRPLPSSMQKHEEVVPEPTVVKPTPEPIKHDRVSEKDIFKNDNTFPFPDFDEDEFESNMSSNIPLRSKTPEVSRNNISQPSRPTNVIEYERQRKVEKRTEYNHHQKIETTVTTDRKKFRPSPIISPVYGVLNEDYKPEDIKQKIDSNGDEVSIDVDSVRRKAFGEIKPEVKEEPAPIYYEETETVTTTFPEYEKKEKVKTIDELLEDTSDMKINLDEEFEITEEINVPDLDVKPKAKKEPIIDDFEESDTLENDLFDLIDSMYESREEE